MQYRFAVNFGILSITSISHMLVPALHDDVKERPAEEHAHEPAQTRRQLPDIIGEELSLNIISILYRYLYIIVYWYIIEEEMEEGTRP